MCRSGHEKIVFDVYDVVGFKKPVDSFSFGGVGNRLFGWT